MQFEGSFFFLGPNALLSHYIAIEYKKLQDGNAFEQEVICLEHFTAVVKFMICFLLFLLLFFIIFIIFRGKKFLYKAPTKTCNGKLPFHIKLLY